MKIMVEIPDEFADVVRRSAAYEGRSVEQAAAWTIVEGALTLMADVEDWLNARSKEVERVESDFKLFEASFATPAGIN